MKDYYISFFFVKVAHFLISFFPFFQFVSSLQSMAFLAVLSPLEQTKVSSNSNLDLPLPQKMKDELSELLSLKRSINLNNNF